MSYDPKKFVIPYTTGTYQLQSVDVPFVFGPHVIIDATVNPYKVTTVAPPPARRLCEVPLLPGDSGLYFVPGVGPHSYQSLRALLIVLLKHQPHMEDQLIAAAEMLNLQHKAATAK